MSHTPSLHRRLLPAFAGAMLLLGAMGAAARAESYGNWGTSGKVGGMCLGPHPRGLGIFPEVVGAEPPCSASRVGALNQVLEGASSGDDALEVVSLAGIGALSYNGIRFSVWRKSPRVLLLVS